MDVDRRRFLELVAALACVPALHCATTPPESTVVVAPLDIKPISVDAGGPLAVVGTPPDAAAPAPPPPASSSLGIWGLAYDPAAAARSCAQLKCPGPSQEAMGALRSHCKALSDTLRTEPFQRFLTCMMAVNNTSSTCDLALVGTEKGECLESWSSPPAIDPATASKCTPIVAACNGPKRSVYAEGALSMETCQRIFSVTSAKGERRMIHCVTEYCGGAPGLCYMASMY